MQRKPWLLPAVVIGVVVLVVAVVIGALGALDGEEAGGRPSDTLAGASAEATASPRPTARPIPGHEVYGFIPYWEMDEGIAKHVAGTDLSTIALFSVTARKDGSINTPARG